MEQPEGFKIKGQEHKVLRLRRALYVLKQAALSWWKELAGSMKKLGFKRLSSDAGLFVYKTKSDLIVAVVYFDDAMFFGKNKTLVMQKKQEFMDTWECLSGFYQVTLLSPDPLGLRYASSRLHLPTSTPVIDNPDPRILTAHCRYSSFETSMSSPSIIPIDHILRHGQRHSHLFFILLGISIHSTLVYSYHHFVFYPQFEYQLSFPQSFVSLSLSLFCS